MDEIKGSIKRRYSVLYHVKWHGCPKKKDWTFEPYENFSTEPGRNCTSFTSTTRQPPVITESLRTKRSISAVLYPFPLMTKATAIGLQPSPPTPSNNTVIDRALGAEISTRSLRQLAEYWILTSCWHTTPPRAPSHEREGRRGWRTSVTTIREVSPLTARGRAWRKGGMVSHLTY